MENIKTLDREKFKDIETFNQKLAEIFEDGWTEKLHKDLSTQFNMKVGNYDPIKINEVINFVFYRTYDNIKWPLNAGTFVNEFNKNLAQIMVFVYNDDNNRFVRAGKDWNLFFGEWARLVMNSIDYRTNIIHVTNLLCKVDMSLFDMHNRQGEIRFNLKTVRTEDGINICQLPLA